MKGRCFYISDHRFQPIEPMIIVGVDDSTRFRRSFLSNGKSIEYSETSPTTGKVLRHRDREVTHYTMTGNIDPVWNSGTTSSPKGCFSMPESWDGGYTLGETNEWSSGINFCSYYRTGEYASWFEYGPGNCAFSEVFEIRQVGDEYHLFYGRDHWLPRGLPYPTYRCATKDEGRCIWKDVSGRWVCTSIRTSSGRLVTIRDFGYVDYTLLDPIPYYWMDHMAEIRPWTTVDTEALSEVIRNTISENLSLNTNSYANLAEAIDLVNDARTGEIFSLISDAQDIFRTLSRIFRSKDAKYLAKQAAKLGKQSVSEAGSAWLAYRYAYNTTKSDIEQSIKAVKEDYLSTIHPDRVLRGSIGISNGTCRVKMRLHEDIGAGFDHLLANAYKRGFFPGLYNLWDMIPGSFIADWGSHLGDYLEDIDSRFLFNYFKVDELLVSYKQTLTVDEVWGTTTYSWYERTLLDAMPQWEIYEGDKASGKTVTYRTIDAASILLS